MDSTLVSLVSGHQEQGRGQGDHEVTREIVILCLRAKGGISCIITHPVCPPGAELGRCAARKKLFHETQSPMPPENLLLAIADISSCASAVSASEHVHWSYVPHPPLFQLIEGWIQLLLSLLMTLCLLMDLGTTITSKRGLHLIFPWDLNHFLLA